MRTLNISIPHENGAGSFTVQRDELTLSAIIIARWHKLHAEVHPYTYVPKHGDAVCCYEHGVRVVILEEGGDLKGFYADMEELGMGCAWVTDTFGRGYAGCSCEAPPEFWR